VGLARQAEAWRRSTAPKVGPEPGQGPHSRGRYKPGVPDTNPCDSSAVAVQFPGRHRHQKACADSPPKGGRGAQVATRWPRTSEGSWRLLRWRAILPTRGTSISTTATRTTTTWAIRTKFVVCVEDGLGGAAMNSEAEHDWCGVRALERAARACERRKRARPDSIAFRMKEGEELFALSNRLRSNTYWPQPGRVFVTERPKYREVHAAVYRDRVVHHLLYALLEPIFEPTFSDASFACRKGKGTHAAVAHLQARMWALSRHGGQRVFALSIDVANFFMSLHRPTLLALMEPKVKHLPAWETIRRVVLNNPGASARRVGRLHLFAQVPRHKRMGALGPDRSLPIGNLTSQFFANVYLSPLDHFIARTLQIRGYARYVDDFVLLDIDEQRLVSAHARVVAFLHERLAEIEQSAKPIVIRRGVRLGMPGLGSIKGPLRCTRVNENEAEQLRVLWASYEGHLAKASAWRLRQQLWAALGAGHRLLKRHRFGAVRRRFPLIRPSVNFRAQVQRLAGGITPSGGGKQAVLVVQVGRFAELPYKGPRFGLKRYVGPAGVRGRSRFGLPWRFAHSLMQRILRAGYPVAVAMEDDELCGNVKRRRIAYLFEPWNDPEDKETA